MTEKMTITQKATIGSDTTQIANQTNYYGMTPAEASRLAIDLFMENFPRLQEEATKTVQLRVNELIKEVIRQIEEKHASNYSAFSDPDMQYILLEAEKGYARRGTDELCSILSSLIADRSACKDSDYLKIVLDKAIETVSLLQPEHLNYLSLIFLYKHVKFGDISTLDDIKEKYQEIHRCFNCTINAENAIPFFNMLGLLTLNLGTASKVVSTVYGFSEQEIKEILPPEHGLVPADYGLTPASIVLAIFNARSKIDLDLKLQTWIHK